MPESLIALRRTLSFIFFKDLQSTDDLAPAYLFQRHCLQFFSFRLLIVTKPATTTRLLNQTTF